MQRYLEIAAMQNASGGHQTRNRSLYQGFSWHTATDCICIAGISRYLCIFRIPIETS